MSRPTRFSSGTQAGYDYASKINAKQADVDGYTGKSTSFQNGMQQYVDDQTANDGTSQVQQSQVQNASGQTNLSVDPVQLWNSFNAGEIQLVQAKAQLANPDPVSPDAPYLAAQEEVNKQVDLNKQNNDDVIARLKADQEDANLEFKPNNIYGPPSLQ